jgi:2-methylcitrate dehydratase PrpD
LTIRRRSLLGAAGAGVALAGLPLARARAETDITAQLASYMAGAGAAKLPDEVVEACKLHVLDTFGAMVSGSRLQPGKEAIAYVRSLGGNPEASVVGTGLQTNVVEAALANGMCAHSDETDDFEASSKAHPGSSTVPAALAMAEWQGRDGVNFIRAVTLGYDLGCRLILALGQASVRGHNRSAEGTASTFCALGGAAVPAGLNEMQMRYAISYASQQVSGLWSWVEDSQHIEKSFDFAGMGARNGVMAVSMVKSGMTGVSDVLDTQHNLFAAISLAPQPELMVAGLGNDFYITKTSIKAYSVGYPIQSVIDAMLKLRKQYRLTPDNVKAIQVQLPTDAVGIVGASAMPDVNCPYIVAVALLKGRVSFQDADDFAEMRQPEFMAQSAKVKVVADQALMDPAAPRGAIVTVTTNDGQQFQHFTKYPPGTVENPMGPDDVADKARDLMGPVLGGQKTEALIKAIMQLEMLKNIRQLRGLITA